MASDYKSLSAWIVPIVTAVISIGGSYITTRLTANGAVEVARTQAAAAIQASKESADAAIAAAKATNRVEMAKLAMTFINDKSTPDPIRAWALRVLAECTDVPLTDEETQKIVNNISSMADEIKFGDVPWSTIDNPKVEAIYDGLKKDEEFHVILGMKSMF